MYVRRMTIEGIKAFERIDLDFARSDRAEAQRYAGLNFFVGGNSSGKSTLLKCIAMALSGPTVSIQHLVTTEGWLRRGAKMGEIEIDLAQGVEDKFTKQGRAPDAIKVGLRLRSRRDKLPPVLEAKPYEQPNNTPITSAERGPWSQESRGWFLAAYGPLRRLTGSSTEALRYALGGGKVASCVTLFREDAALSESDLWLRQQYVRAALQRKNADQPASDLVADVTDFLNSGLLPQGFRISRTTEDDVFMETPNGGELPLRDISGGCRSAYALVLDIVHNMIAAYGDKDLFSREKDQILVKLPGVVLVDEIEAHVHPSWQGPICDWLRTRFPRIQFFITTHSPLTLQNADDDGIFVLPLPNELDRLSVRKLSKDEQMNILLGRADRVLLGEAFGLRQTWGHRADELVRRWERLAALSEQGVELSGVEKKQYEALKSDVELIFDLPDLEPNHA
jgi:hypothetical protein